MANCKPDFGLIPPGWLAEPQDRALLAPHLSAQRLHVAGSYILADNWVASDSISQLGPTQRLECSSFLGSILQPLSKNSFGLKDS